MCSEAAWRSDNIQFLKMFGILPLLAALPLD